MVASMRGPVWGFALVWAVAVVCVHSLDETAGLCDRLMHMATIDEPRWGKTFEDSAGNCIRPRTSMSAKQQEHAARVRRHQAARQVPLECIPVDERPKEDLYVQIQAYDREFECTSISDDIYIPVAANGCTNIDLTTGASIWITVSDGASMGTTQGSTVSWKLYADDDCPQDNQLLEGTYRRNRPYPRSGAAMCNGDKTLGISLQVTPFFKKCSKDTAHPESVCRQSPRPGEICGSSNVGRRRNLSRRPTIYTPPHGDPVVQFPFGFQAVTGGQDPTLKLVNENAEFTSIDANKDDKLSQSELRDYLKSQAWVEADQEEAGAASVIGDQGYDTDRDGLINLCEFARGLEADEQKPEVSRLWYLAKNPNANCSVAEWSECHGNCTRTPTITTAQRGSGAACPPEPACALGEGLCPRDCEASWSECTAQCTRTLAITQQAKNGGTACPTSADEPACSAGEDQCPPDIHCVGAWLGCGADCTKTYEVTTAQSGQGTACAHSDGATQDCEPGEGLCPQACEFSWSECTAQCTRTLAITQQALNGGTACPTPEDQPACSAGEGQCPSLPSLNVVIYFSGSDGSIGLAEKHKPLGYQPNPDEVVDKGIGYPAPSSNGYKYGWSCPLGQARSDTSGKRGPSRSTYGIDHFDRHQWCSIHKQSPAIWQLDLPNGNYAVDVIFPEENRFGCRLQGEKVCSGLGSNTDGVCEVSRDVTVTNGKLTISGSAYGGNGNMMDYICHSVSYLSVRTM